MSIEKVRAYFKEFNMDDKISEFEVSSAICLTIPELEEHSNYTAWVDVCKLPAEN